MINQILKNLVSLKVTQAKATTTTSTAKSNFKWNVEKKHQEIWCIESVKCSGIVKIISICFVKVSVRGVIKPHPDDLKTK